SLGAGGCLGVSGGVTSVAGGVPDLGGRSAAAALGASFGFGELPGGESLTLEGGSVLFSVGFAGAVGESTPPSGADGDVGIVRPCRMSRPAPIGSSRAAGSCAVARGRDSTRSSGASLTPRFARESEFKP